MNKMIAVKRVIFALLAVCISLSAGASVLAENYSISALEPKTDRDACNKDHKQYLENAVLKLVEEGKLSKDKADKIIEFKSKRAEKPGKLTLDQRKQMKKGSGRGSLLRDLIQEGIITEEEAGMIKEKLREMKEARIFEKMQNLLDSGILSAEDIKNIRNYMQKDREEKREQVEKLKNMTPEERKGYIENIRKEKKDIITRMLEDNIITEKQAEEIRKAIPELSRIKTRKF